SASTSVPRFWRICLALWLISRWRLPATPCLILPVAVSLKRFFTPLFVFSLGIFVSLLRLTRDVCEPPRQPYRPGRSFLPKVERSGAYRGEGPRRQDWSPPCAEGVGRGTMRSMGVGRRAIAPPPPSRWFPSP